MINEYLKERETRRASNTKTGLISLEGEEIISVILLDEEKTFILMKSGNGIELHSNGAYILLDNKATKETLKTYLEEAKGISENYNKIIKLNLFNDKSDKSNENELEDKPVKVENVAFKPVKKDGYAITDKVEKEEEKI